MKSTKCVANCASSDRLFNIQPLKPSLLLLLLLVLKERNYKNYTDALITITLSNCRSINWRKTGFQKVQNRSENVFAAKKSSAFNILRYNKLSIISKNLHKVRKGKRYRYSKVPEADYWLAAVTNSSRLSAHCPDTILSVSCYCLTAMSLRSGRTCADLSCSNSRGKLQLWMKYWIWNTSVDFRETLRLDIMSDSLGEQRTTMFTRGHHHFDPLWMICTAEIILKFLFLNMQLAAWLIIYRKCSITDLVRVFSSALHHLFGLLS